MNKEQCAFTGFVAGAGAMLLLMIFLYQGTTSQKIDTKAHEAKQACEATLPRNISCEVVITAVPKIGEE